MVRKMKTEKLEKLSEMNLDKRTLKLLFIFGVISLKDYVFLI